MAVLSVEQVTKRFGTVQAVDNVSFEVVKGRVFGLLGPNGAGKTTTIRMITYITVPDTGRVVFEGKEVGTWSQDRMGYLPEERGLYKKMRVGEQLVYLCRLKGMQHKEAKASVEHWLDRFDASDWLGKKTQELSKGMQQKLQFVATIAHDPDLLIFDEPFSGLDPINADMLREIILELNAAGKTILFASHRMEQVERMCDDICLISNSRTVLSGSLRDIKRGYGRDTVELEFEGDSGIVRSAAGELGIRISSLSNNHAELRLSNPEQSPQLLRRLVEGITVNRFELVEPSLNDIFISVVESSSQIQPDQN